MNILYLLCLICPKSVKTKHYGFTGGLWAGLFLDWAMSIIAQT